MSFGPETAPPPVKVDPKKLELRARPRPAVRFRKGLILGIAGGAAGLIALLSWFSLEPPDLTMKPGPRALQPTLEPSEVLANAPSRYDEVPVLGPPLPGDLGRPLLKQRHRPGDESLPVLTNDPRPYGRNDEGAFSQSSSLLVTLGRPGRGKQALSSSDAAGMTVGERPLPLLTAGTIIPASLITGINSDVPGVVLAQVTEPVRDSASGTFVLIPQGSRLIGEYGDKVGFGQKRIMLNWNMLVLPDGRSVLLDKLPAADSSGYAGLVDKVDFHGWRMIEGIALSTALGIGAELNFGDEDEALARALGDSAQSVGDRAGNEITRRNLDIQPTITIRPGWPLRLILVRDLALEPWS